MKLRISIRSFWTIVLVAGLGIVPAGLSPAMAGQAKMGAPQTAVIVSVLGEATLTSPTTQDARPAVFREAVLSGDRLITGTGGALELLVENQTLVTMRSHSMLTVAPSRSSEMELQRGALRLATGTGALTLWTPHTRVTLNPGTLVEVEVRALSLTVTAPPVEPVPAGQPVRTALGSGVLPAPNETTPDPVIESFSVLEGSIDVAPMSPSAEIASVNVPAGQRLRIVDGIPGPQTAAIGGTLQPPALPVFPLHHTSTPSATQQLMLARETTQAQVLLKMLDPSAPTPTVPNELLQGSGTWANATGTTDGASLGSGSSSTSSLASTASLTSTSSLGTSLAGLQAGTMFDVNPTRPLASSLLSSGLTAGAGQTLTINGDAARIINTNATFGDALFALAEGSTLNLQGHLYYIDPSNVLFTAPNGALKVTGAVNAAATIVTVLGDVGGASTVYAELVPLVTVSGSGNLKMTGNPGLLNLSSVDATNGGIFTSEKEILLVSGSLAKASSTNTLINVDTNSELYVGFLAAGPPYAPTGPTTKVPAVNVVGGTLTTLNLLTVGDSATGNIVDINGSLLKLASTGTINGQLLLSNPSTANNSLTFRDYLMNLIGSKLFVKGNVGGDPGIEINGDLSITDPTLGPGFGGGILTASGTSTATVTSNGLLYMTDAPVAGGSIFTADKTLFVLKDLAKLAVTGTGVTMSTLLGGAELTVDSGGLYSGANTSIGSFTGRLVDIEATGGNASLTGNTDLVTLSGLAKLTAGNGVVIDVQALGATDDAFLTVNNGGVVNITGGTATFNSQVVNVSSALDVATLSTAEDVFRVSGALSNLIVGAAGGTALNVEAENAATLSSDKGLLKMVGGKATFGGTLAKVFSMNDSAVILLSQAGGIDADAISMTGGTLAVNGAGAALSMESTLGSAGLINFDFGVNGGGVLKMNGGSATFNGTLVEVLAFLTGEVINVGNTVDITNAALNVKGTAPAIDVHADGIAQLEGANALLKMAGGSATFAGSLAMVQSDSLDASIELGGNAIDMNGGTLSFKNTGGGNTAAIDVVAPLGTATVDITGGGVLKMNGGSATFGTSTDPLNLLRVSGGTAQVDADESLIRLANSATLTINNAGNSAIEVIGSDLTVNNGGILDSTNSTVKVLGTLADIEGDITATGQYLAKVSGKTATIGGDLVVNRNTTIGGSDIGGLLSAQNGAKVAIGGDGLVLDNAVVEATLNLVKVIGGTLASTVTMGGDAVQVGSTFNMGDGLNTPGQAVMLLDKGKLSAATLFNVLNSGAVNIQNFNLIELRNGSSATLAYLFIVNAASGSTFSLGGGSLTKFGAGTNTLTLTNTCAGCDSVQTVMASGQTIKVGLMNGASIGQVDIHPNFVPFENLTGTNKLVMPAAGAHFLVDGVHAGPNVTLKPTP